MPFINIKIARSNPTAEQKAEVIKRVTQVMQEVLGKKPENTMVMIEEVDTDNVGLGGVTITEKLKGA